MHHNTNLMSENHYTFTAIRGKQGSQNYFIVNCPLQLVPRIFIFDQLIVAATGFRYETLSPTQIEKISKYVISNADDFLLAPIIVEVENEPSFDKLQPERDDLVLIRIPMDVHMEVLEGKHRCAAIQLAVATDPTLSAQTVPVMIVVASQHPRSNSLRVGLELEATPTSLSHRVFQNEDEPLSVLVKELASTVPVFQNRIEVTKTTISNRSSMLFTLSALYQATKALLGIDKSGTVTETDERVAYEFWCQISELIPEWQKLLKGEITTSYLRENYVHVHTMMLISIGKVGYILTSTYPNDWSNRLQLLASLDWSRTNVDTWEGRAMVQGRMSKAHRHINLTVNFLKMSLNLPLTDKEQLLETELV